MMSIKDDGLPVITIDDCYNEFEEMRGRVHHTSYTDEQLMAIIVARDHPNPVPWRKISEWWNAKFPSFPKTRGALRAAYFRLREDPEKHGRLRAMVKRSRANKQTKRK